jgi:hypothetical protein
MKSVAVRHSVLCGLAMLARAGAGDSAPPPPATRWILVYAGSTKGGIGTTYSVDDFVHLLSAVDSSGRSLRWLGTGAILLHLYAPSGHTFTTWIGGPPATGADWETYLDSLLLPGGALARLDSAVEIVGTAVGPLGARFPVALMIPYPDPKADTVRFENRRYALDAPEGRAAAASAYTRAATGRFDSRRFPHLRLDGFYWLSESVAPSDTALVQRTAVAVHALHTRLLWVPYFFAHGQDQWRQLGFDEAWLQPNFFFSLQVPQVRLDSAAIHAGLMGLGIEVEFNAKIYTDPKYADRLGPYLTTLAAYPGLRARAVVVYDGQGALIHLAKSSQLQDRAIYARLVEALTTGDSVDQR